VKTQRALVSVAAAFAAATLGAYAAGAQEANTTLSPQALREIAQVVNLHESRISQLKSQAILRLRSSQATASTR